MTTIALLGTGLLGEAIGCRLLHRGVTLRVWNRSAEKCEPLLKQGAALIENLAGAAKGCQAVITVLRDGPVSAEVIAQLGDLDAVCCLPMGTMGISESRQLELQVQAQQGVYLEAPVLGSKPEALKGTLLVMAGGSAEVLQQQLPLLRLLSEAPKWMGATGSAAASKLALNQLIASLTHGYSLALRLVQASGLEVESFMEVLRPSALYAPTVDKKLERMLTHDFTNPNFSTALMRKDLQLFVREAGLAGLNAEALAGLVELLTRAEGTPLDAADYSALHALTAGSLL
ncbi:3-hydroxyacid dehydrogenase [Synechococcus sp. WH 8020]|uniref:NAD(P)-dependent oxidoreductase n=1 Tax=Synechococcus sp. (strain WH8020) TaxID=32052 RepID=UPI0006526DFB|nr:NAD(P)-dependent oxidoreductase [Synechococcus sp. WH 8020]AKN60070.1 3-hydroxyacid dehydrogenase [Synechococcus sp. WH 8020]